MNPARRPANFIGFATANGDNNVISGNKTWGVYISDVGTNNNTVANNFIGTNVTGNARRAQRRQWPGHRLRCAGQHVGGTTAAARNVISGNFNEGVLIGFAGTANNVVEGNFIGTDVTGRRPLANAADSTGSTSAWVPAATPSADRTPSAASTPPPGTSSRATSSTASWSPTAGLPAP